MLGLRFDQGALMLADRRATAGNLIMYERAEKIIALDDFTLMAISGSFARSVEVGRFLKHSFKYYRRAVMSELSLEGKLMEISRSLASNLPAAMDGIGMFLPVVAAYDTATDRFGLYFFDPAGARFENGEYICAGSGSERIRGIFEYLNQTKGPSSSRPLDDVLGEGLRMLDIAAELDSATGGFQRVLPVAMVLTKEGVTKLSDEKLKEAIAKLG